MQHGLQRLRVALGIGWRGDELVALQARAVACFNGPDAERQRARVGLHDDAALPNDRERHPAQLGQRRRSDPATAAASAGRSRA